MPTFSHSKQMYATAQQLHAVHRADASRHRCYLESVVPSPEKPFEWQEHVRVQRFKTCCHVRRQKCRKMLARAQARATLSLRCTGQAFKVRATRRCWARGSTTFARRRTKSTSMSALAQLLWRLKMKMLSPLKCPPKALKTTCVKTVLFAIWTVGAAAGWRDHLRRWPST